MLKAIGQLLQLETILLILRHSFARVFVFLIPYLMVDHAWGCLIYAMNAIKCAEAKVLGKSSTMHPEIEEGLDQTLQMTNVSINVMGIIVLLKQYLEHPSRETLRF